MSDVTASYGTPFDFIPFSGYFHDEHSFHKTDYAVSLDRARQDIVSEGYSLEVFPRTLEQIFWNSRQIAIILPLEVPSRS